MNTQNLFDAYTKLCSMQRSNGVAIHMHRSGSATVAIDGIRLLLSAGNITSGTFTLYGIKKS